MKNMIIKYRNLIILLLAFTIFSCDKMEDNYSQYLEGGEINYSSKPLNLMGQAGFKRIQLSWDLTTVNNVKEAIIAFNDQEIKVPVSSAQNNSVRYIVNNLEEGIYDFEVYTISNSENKSLISSAIVSSYGEKYQSGLNIQKLENFSYDGDILNFDVIGDFKNLIGYKIEYTKQNGELETKYYAKGEFVEGFNVKAGSDIKIYSAYLPELTAIDTIFSNPFTYATPPKSYVLDHTLFKLANLPMDIPRFEPELPAAEQDWHNAWDGNRSTGKVFLERKNPKPSFVTIDLGVKVQLTKFELVGFLPWPPISVKQYQLWGIGDDKDINEVATTTDIHDISSLSPEDQSDAAKVAAKKAENFEAWKAESLDKGWKLLIDDNRADSEGNGFTQSITEETKIRYVRLVIIDNFSNNNPDIGLNEIIFTGLVPID